MEVEGEVAYFGLRDWWQKELTTDEQNTILSVFQARTNGAASSSGSSLITGKIYSSTGTALEFLSELSGLFTKPEHRIIGYKIIRQAEKLASGRSRVLDLHLLYQAKMQVYYRNRSCDEFALASAIEACNQQIAISEKVKQEFKKEGRSLPAHAGYKQLCIIFEKQEKYEEVIRLSHAAKKQGWAGDWDKKIEKSEEKMHQISR